LWGPGPPAVAAAAIAPPLVAAPTRAAPAPASARGTEAARAARLGAGTGRQGRRAGAARRALARGGWRARGPPRGRAAARPSRPGVRGGSVRARAGRLSPQALPGPLRPLEPSAPSPSPVRPSSPSHSVGPAGRPAGMLAFPPRAAAAGAGQGWGGDSSGDGGAGREGADLIEVADVIEAEHRHGRGVPARAKPARLHFLSGEEAGKLGAVQLWESRPQSGAADIDRVSVVRAGGISTGTVCPAGILPRPPSSRTWYTRFSITAHHKHNTTTSPVVRTALCKDYSNVNCEENGIVCHLVGDSRILDLYPHLTKRPFTSAQIQL
jgi:hypothetical protein